MKNYSGHIIFEENFQWKDLEKYFPDMWEIIEGEAKLNPEENQFDDILLFVIYIPSIAFLTYFTPVSGFLIIIGGEIVSKYATLISME